MSSVQSEQDAVWQLDPELACLLFGGFDEQLVTVAGGRKTAAQGR